MATLALCLLCAAVAATAALAAPQDKGAMAMQRVEDGRWAFGGPLGQRIVSNVAQWILRAPEANPGILDMFRRRDRKHPYAEHTPWAGEFAGKYLISAVQAVRIEPSAKLRRHVAAFVRDLIATQDRDGYLGPWPRGRRLMGDCDLWGHYHCMLGLLMWADDTGDKDARAAVLRAAECICKLYVDSGRRPIEAGNPCFNLSVLHIIADLHRRTGSERYLALIRRIEQDLARDGDWLRQGFEGKPYWRLPGSGPRWEALHILQGLVSRWQATGDERYRKAVLNHWTSIRDLDRHPSGAFSTNEQASGTVFAQGSIETCCSVAWMALTTDVLRLTGDPTVADELELTLWNQALAAQHPSGSWCTYDTPLNGVRAPSYHQINFQYRPGSPELNCCSVNSPRTLGMLPDWAALRQGKAVVLNFYGPGEMVVPLAGKERLWLRQKTAYPADGAIRIEADAGGKAVELRLRIPAWSRKTVLAVNGKGFAGAVRPGTYVAIKRKWSKGDVVDLRLDMTPRLTLGEGPDRGGRVAIHRGPLLLAFDAGLNDIEVADLPPVDVRSVSLRTVKLPATAAAGWDPRPIGVWSVVTAGGRVVLLCDFASAGARGTEYASWLPASHAKPAAVRLQMPEDEAAGRPGPILFRWSPSGGPEDTYRLVVARDRTFADVVRELDGLKATTAQIDSGLEGPGAYWWKVVATNRWGETVDRDGGRSFTVSPDASNRFLAVRADGCLAASGLDGSGDPACGVLTFAEGASPVADRHSQPGGAVEFDGRIGGLRYRLARFPEDDYSFVGWVRLSERHAGMGQIMSAWCRGMDDPLRVTVEGRELSAKIEAGNAYRTEAARLEPGRWTHVGAVKQGGSLRLYVDGVEVGRCAVPERVRTMATEIGIGFNPFFAGGERLAGAVDDFAFYARALTPAEITAAAREAGPR